jgi:alpha-beta hydrolase superfamily lysophospholipase
MAQEATFQSFDGGTFYERFWPIETPRGHVLLIHGYGEHCARFDHVAAHLNSLGLAVHAYDQRGHGRSPGKRGYIADFNDLLRDLDAFHAHVQPRVADAPLLALGHSMGGLVCVRYLQERAPQWRGAVLSSPLLQLEEVSPVLLALAGILSRLTPWLPVATLDSSALTRDPAVVQAYNEDPLVYHGRIVARTGQQLNDAVAKARAHACCVRMPLYLFHGTADRLAPCAGSQFFHDKCASPDKTLKCYEGGQHELMNDYDKDAVIAEVGRWLVQHL